MQACVLSVQGGCAGAMQSLWLSGALCDVSLCCGDFALSPPLPCHRVVLAAASPFFRCAGARVTHSHAAV